MSNSYVSGCGATVEIMEGYEARFDLRLSDRRNQNCNYGS